MNISSASDCLPVSSASWQPFPSKTPKKIPVKRPPVSLDRFILLKGIPAGIALLLLSIPYGATTNYVAVYAREIGLHVPTGFFFHPHGRGDGHQPYLRRKVRGPRIHHPDYLVWFLCSHCGILPAIPAALRSLLTAKHGVLSYSTSYPFMLGIGFGVMFPAYNTLYVNLAPNNQRGTATSTYLTSWDIGIGLGISTGGYIAQQYAFDAVYLFGSILCVTSMLFFNLYVSPHYHRNKVR